jgi:hypothetical protein
MAETVEATSVAIVRASFMMMEWWNVSNRQR